MIDRRQWLLPGSQLAVAVVGFMAFGVVKGKYVPEVAVFVLIPAAFTVLTLAGIVTMFRNLTRASTTSSDIALVIGTTLCGVLMVVTVAASIWANFVFDWSGLNF